MVSQSSDLGARLAIEFLDFRRFCGLLQIRLKAPDEASASTRRMQMVLTPLQKKYNGARTGRDIILKPRQVFMTTLEAARDLWWFLTKHGAHVIVVVQSQTNQDALKDVSEKFRIFFDSLLRLGVKLEFGRDASAEWTLPKRDASLRIIQAGASEAAAERKGRGGTVNRLHLSEMAFWGAYAEDTFLSLTESVPKEGSEIVNESTANGAFGFYHDQWKAAVEGRSAYKPHFVAWYDHPEYKLPLTRGDAFAARNGAEEALLAKGVTPEQLNWRRWKISDKGGDESAVSQEYPSDPDTCFLVSGRGFFEGAIVDAMLQKAARPVVTQHIGESGARPQRVGPEDVPSLRVWHEPETGRAYVVAVDTSEGTGGDAGAAIVLERGTGRHMATLWGQFRPWVLAKVVAQLGAKYLNAQVAVERNNHGGTVLRALDAECHYKHIFYDRDEKPGFLTSETSRSPILDTLEQAVRLESFKTNDRFLLSEMRTFTVNARGRAEAGKGAHDDLVMATAIGWDVICRTVRRAGLGGLVA